MLTAISPIDGRYQSKTTELKQYFSEQALIKYRVKVEIEYLIEISKLGLKNLPAFSTEAARSLREIIEQFSEEDGQKIKTLEATTNHDVKAVEYFLKQALTDLGLSTITEFVHFGLTSQDINNTALPLMIKDSLDNVIVPQLNQILKSIVQFSVDYKGQAMLAKTHGQPASPTTLGKEFLVYEERLSRQLDILTNYTLRAKFGGATGNFNAHKVSYPDIDWRTIADSFISKLGLDRMNYTTQIAHYDEFAVVFDCLARINTILIDLCQDIWSYISMDYFKQKTIKGEIGSSTMPHKVNPIDFENAEGNFKLANALYRFLSEKLPVSRLQRDLTDSTVGRNIGVPLAHSLIGFKSLEKGFSKLILNETALHNDLDQNWAVVAEAIQTILRREQYPNPYEALKDLTRGKTKINKEDIHQFINDLDLDEVIKEELRDITPFNYLGYF